MHKYRDIHVAETILNTSHIFSIDNGGRLDKIV